ncbi:LysR family transcriptional regulator [Paraburkholderia bannensis]|uniref:LysR family transcriptional regulator n=1 Tax=Paraburkholderia bannensis TaxID=765414 RepID=UPI002AC33662|nr:LysR family transcriptional regulator [Paraburkholderia bannensis]
MDYFAGIRSFLYASESGSFSKAAERLGVKTSTVSRYITALEKDLGIALFNRSTRGLVLTEGGRVFRQQAVLVMQTLEEAREVTSSLNLSPRGLLRVTIPSSFGRRHIIPHLPAFMARFPKIDVDVIVTDEVVNLVDAAVDLAVRTGALPDSQLMARQLTNHRRLACASPSYITKRGQPTAPSDLAEHEMLRFSLSPDDRWIFVKREKGHPSQEVSVDLRGRLRINDTDSLLELAVKGHGIALLPTWACEQALKDGQLVTLLPEWEVQLSKATPGVWAVYPRKKTVSSKVRAFIDFYSAIFARELP